MALSEAVRIARVNTKASDIGRVIESTITKFGFKPIQNLAATHFSNTRFMPASPYPTSGLEGLHFLF